jgi:tetratricopeptide (TPR) repeat protein
MQPHDDDHSVRHLIELGYIDPDEIVARGAAARRQRDVELARAVELTSQGNLHEAAALTEKLATDNPDWVAPRQLLAELRYRAGRFSEAKAEHDWLTYHGVEHPRLALIAGAMALNRRDLPAALEELEYARYVEPKLPSVHTLCGTALARLGRFDEAADAFRHAIEQTPSDARALDGLAAIGLCQGRFEEAADWALQALEHNLQLFRAHYHLGVALMHLNRPHEALQALETSARVDPLRRAPFYWLSRIAQRTLNDPALAARYRQRGRDVIRGRRNRRCSDHVSRL